MYSPEKVWQLIKRNTQSIHLYIIMQLGDVSLGSVPNSVMNMILLFEDNNFHGILCHSSEHVVQLINRRTTEVHRVVCL